MDHVGDFLSDEQNLEKKAGDGQKKKFLFIRVSESTIGKKVQMREETRNSSHMKEMVVESE